MAIQVSRKSSVPLTIIKTGLLIGTLDAVAAILWRYYYTRVISLNVFKFIASGIFGKTAFAGGNRMIAYGVVIHYFIALTFTTVLFLLYRFFNFILRYKYAIGVLYGIIIWAIMNLIVVPFSDIVQMPLIVNNILIGCIILIVCVGLPIALMAHSYYYKVKGRLLYL